MDSAVRKYENYVRTTAKIDLGLFTLLALPYVSVMVLAFLFGVGADLGDMRPMPDLSGPVIQLTISLVGLFGLFTVWARMQASGAQAGFAVGVLKLAAAALFGLAILKGAPLVFCIFLIADLMTGLQLILRRP